MSLTYHFFSAEADAKQCYEDYTRIRPDWIVSIYQGISSGARGWYVIYGPRG